jgi:hypothetical protein
MPLSTAKVVTIITVFDAREFVLQGFADLGVDSFSSSHVDGIGVHGTKRHGLIEAGNLVYTIVASEQLSDRILAWAEQHLVTRHPSIAYSTHATVVSARAIT